MTTGTEDRGFTVRNPEFARAVADSFSRQGMLTGIGARLVAVAPGSCAIAVGFNPDLSQQNGWFHGAAIGALADTAGGYAAMSLMPEGSEVLTVEYKINFVRPAAGKLLIARGTVLRSGRTLTVAQIDVVVRQDDSDGDGPEDVVALAQGTFMRVANAATA